MERPCDRVEMRVAGDEDMLVLAPAAITVVKRQPEMGVVKGSEQPDFGKKGRWNTSRNGESDGPGTPD